VHSGALGWVAMVSIGAIYHLIPVLFDKPKMHSIYLINLHFWLATIGVVLYIVAMWMSGVLQGLMWRAINTDGTLTYSFVEALEASKPFYLLRFIGGLFVVSGMLIMAYNCYKTIRSKPEEVVSDSDTQVQPA
jgi:cytochrome c oxidase cbb3-type subunit 1